MGGGRDRQQLGDALHHAQHRDLGVTERHESGVDPLRTDFGHIPAAPLRAAAFTYGADALSSLLRRRFLEALN